MLPSIAETLARWQADPWQGHLHPGDLGWHASVGTEQMARDLRVWAHDATPVALAMLDGSDVVRMAVDPGLACDEGLAARIADDLDTPGAGFFTGNDAIVEARGAHALRARLSCAGWVDDEPWTPMALDLGGALDTTRIEGAGVRIEQVGPGDADDWTSVHWSAFRGTPYDDEARARFARRWTTLMASPVADRARCLVAYTARDVPVAVITVWTAGAGRPGLVEPMGVHRDHHGLGYGVAITLAGAAALQRDAASSATVVAESSNPAAVATYRSAGFRSLGTVTDLRRP